MSDLKDSTAIPIFLPRKPETQPRVVCFCQPVCAIISASVAPPLRKACDGCHRVRVEIEPGESLCNGCRQTGALCAHCLGRVPGVAEPKPGYFILCEDCERLRLRRGCTNSPITERAPPWSPSRRAMIGRYPKPACMAASSSNSGACQPADRRSLRHGPLANGRHGGAPTARAPGQAPNNPRKQTAPERVIQRTAGARPQSSREKHRRPTRSDPSRETLHGAGSAGRRASGTGGNAPSR